MAHLRAHRLYRSLACLLLTSLLLALPMLAAATSLANDLSALSDDELLLLKQFIDAEVEAWGLVPAAGDVQTSDEPLVWIPKSGSKYHATSTCSGMKNPMQVTLSEAKTADTNPAKSAIRRSSFSGWRGLRPFLH